MSRKTGKIPVSIPPEQKYALILLVKEVFSQLSEVVTLKKKGYRAEVSMQILREMCAVLRELDAPLERAYFQVLLSFADKSPSPAAPRLDDASAQATAGAKRRLIRSLKDDLIGNA